MAIWPGGSCWSFCCCAAVLGVITLKPDATSMLSLFCVLLVVEQLAVNANRAMTAIVLNEVRIRFILFLVDDFELSVSSATRKRADQPMRPSVCARQYPEEKLWGSRAFTGIGLWSYYFWAVPADEWSTGILSATGRIRCGEPVWQPGVSPG